MNNENPFENLFSEEIWNTTYRVDENESWDKFIDRLIRPVIEQELDNINLLYKIAPDNIGTIDKVQFLYSKYRDILSNFKFVPGGRIYANLGVKGRESTTLMNCFVHDIMEHPDGIDSISGIYDMLKAQAMTLKSEGGYGTNFSKIRPAGSYIKGVGARTPGVLSFMNLWDKSSEVITGGYYKNKDGKKNPNEKNKIRKGAQMGVLSCFSENTEILTSEGWIDIKEIIDREKNKELIYALDDTGAPHRIFNSFVKEPEELYEIETEDGSFIQVTSDHKFEVKNIETGEIYLKALKDIDPDKEEIAIINQY